jgi:hypothetical protein
VFDLKISSLALAFENSSGHEHRMQPIALRAANVLAERFSASYRVGGQLPRSARLNTITAPALSIDLAHTSDEQAAHQIAGSWFAALVPHLKA